MSTVTHRPRLATAQAAQLAQELFGISGQITELPSERDQNFRVESPQQGLFVLKIANATESKAILDLQNQTMARLARAGVACPQPVPTLGGQEMHAVNGHWVRLLTYLPGKPLAQVHPHSPELLHLLGKVLGQVSSGLDGFDHPAARRDFLWDVQQAQSTLDTYASAISDSGQRALIARHRIQFAESIQPLLAQLRQGVTHHDANDYNVIVANLGLNQDGSPTQPQIGLIDFGDMVHSYVVADLAVALAYVMLDKADPLAAAAAVVRGYHEVFPLTGVELAALFGLTCMRLCMSVAIAAHQQQLQPDNNYLTISETPVWRLLAQLDDLALEMEWGRLAHAAFRVACGLPATAHHQTLTGWLAANRSRFAPIVQGNLATALVLDLSVGSLDLDHPDLWTRPELLAQRIQSHMAQAGADVAIGRYDEARLIYQSDQFATPSDSLPERRTIHLGLDLFQSAGSAVFAPLTGVVHSLADNQAPLDYGPTVIVRHETDSPNPISFYTLYGHLSRESLASLQVGQQVETGEQLGTMGTLAVNGGWPPHLHFQIIGDLMGQAGNFPGVAAPSWHKVWTTLCPDPNLILGIPADRFPAPPMSAEDNLALRRRHLGRNLSISYRSHLKMVRGYRQFLYDQAGQSYLDAVNNVPHVGHNHPHVVRAGQRQMAVLNTNTRYLYDDLVAYAQRLTATMPDPLSVCIFVCTGSEANELALRMARTVTGQWDLITLDGAYHGHTQALIEISPYKHAGPGGMGHPPYVHVAEMPDPYRGRYRSPDTEMGIKYAAHVQTLIEGIQAQGRGVAAYIAESMLGCGGQIVLPQGYLQAAYDHVRQAGGLCIADEVQVGFGRAGTHMWAFETQGVVPDILTLGKPMGNGHPLAAVVTTPEIADAFANGMEYFNTFGGNPVSCAIGMAVLDVMAEERLQENALQVGNRLLAGLAGLQAVHPLIGDVRGLGLYIGVELVLDRTARTPAPAQASYIANRMREMGILISTDGPDHNVLKIKPPLVFTPEDGDRLVETLGVILAEDCLGVDA